MFFTKKLQKYVLFAAIIIILAIEIPIITAGYLTKPEISDTIIILGAKLVGHTPSAILRLRLDEGIKLYNEQYAPVIIVSGAQGKDEEISEAVGMKDYLVDHGIAPERIIIEDQSFNTQQNLLNSHMIMQQQNLKTAIIVSNSSHMRRALVIAESIGMKTSGSPAPMSNNAIFNTRQYLREGAALITLLFPTH